MLFNYICSLIFPVLCINCESPEDWLCKDCKSELIPPADECPYCNRFSMDSQTHKDCFSNFPIKQTISLWDYNQLASRIMKEYKFNHYHSIHKFLLGIAPTPQLSKIPKEAIIVPVPTSINRIKERGFNTAELIAKEICINTPTLELFNNLKIKKELDYQSHKSRKDRLRQKSNNYKITNPEYLNQKTILIVDDVCTTGTTLKNIAKTILKAKPKEIYAFTIFRSSSTAAATRARSTASRRT